MLSGTWNLAKDSLPDIAEGEKCSQEVLGGCWIEDPWLREDHPDRIRFVYGPCRVISVKPSREFPDGKQWHTFGPSHNQITHWAVVVPPNKEA